MADRVAMLMKCNSIMRQALARHFVRPGGADALQFGSSPRSSQT
jgi:hypothetical protein